MAVVALAMAHRLRISLPTDPVASRERFATSRRQPHENREGRTFHPVNIGRRESRPSSSRRWVLFRPSVVFAKNRSSRLFFLHARHLELFPMRGLQKYGAVAKFAAADNRQPHSTDGKFKIIFKLKCPFKDH